MTHAPRGRLLEWSPGLARADGLDGVALGDRVEIEGAGPAFVTALAQGHVDLAPLSSHPASPGTLVTGAGPLEIAASDDLAGRPIDALARPHDRRPWKAGATHRVFFPAPGLCPDVRRGRLTMGLWVFDFKQSIPMGASVLAVGGSPLVARHILRHQAREGRVCVYALLAAGSSATLASRAMFESDPPAPFTIIEPGHDPTPAALWLIPWTAMAMAAHLRGQGRDAVVVLDSLDRWRARMNDFPWQGTWTTQLGRLLGTAQDSGGGSASLLGLASPALARSIAPMFDAGIDLDRALRGAPLVDGSVHVRPPFKVHGLGPIGAAMMRLAELEEWEARQPWVLAPGGSPPEPARSRIDEGLRLREALRFRPDLSPDLVEQLAAFFAVLELPRLPAAAVASFTDSFLRKLRRDLPDLLAAIRQRREYREEDHRSLMAVARQASI